LLKQEKQPPNCPQEKYFLFVFILIHPVALYCLIFNTDGLLQSNKTLHLSSTATCFGSTNHHQALIYEN